MEKTFQALRQYNCWDGKPYQAGFVRKPYLDKITQYLGNKLVKVLIGQRRVGKSYILRQIINYLLEVRQCNPHNMFYLNKEYLVFSEIHTVTDLNRLFTYYRQSLNVTGKIYVFIDEIQQISGWEEFVNSYAQDFTQEYEIFITGSNSSLLSGELASLLSGRYVEFEIFPMGYNEFCAFHELAPGRDSYTRYLQEGGLPELFHLNNEELKRNYVLSLRNTVILRDIIERHKIKEVQLLEDIFRFLMGNIGNMTSFPAIVKYFKSHNKKTNYETVSSYARYFTESFILHQANRYDVKGKKLLGGTRKYYLNDLAFKYFLLGFSPADINYHLENAVYLNLRRAGFNVAVGAKANKEIDFVAEKGTRKMYMQVSYMLHDKQTVEREFGNLLSIQDNYEKYVVSMDDIPYTNYEGIHHLRPWELAGILTEEAANTVSPR